MAGLNVKINYGYEDNNGVVVLYTFEKLFILNNIPTIESYIILNDPMIKEVWFSRPRFYPATNIYNIVNEKSMQLERYNYIHHRRFLIAFEVSEKFRSFKWIINRKEIDDEMNPFSKNWDREHFIRIEKYYTNDPNIDKLLGEMA